MQIKTVVKQDFKQQIQVLQHERNHATVSSLIREMLIVYLKSNAKPLNRNSSFREVTLENNMLRVNLSGLLLRDFLLFCNDNRMNKGNALNFILVNAYKHLKTNQNIKK